MRNLRFLICVFDILNLFVGEEVFGGGHRRLDGTYVLKVLAKHASNSNRSMKSGHSDNSASLYQNKMGVYS